MNHQPICRIWNLLRNAGTATLLRRPICISARLPDSFVPRELNTTASVIPNSATLILKEKEGTFTKSSRPQNISEDQVDKSESVTADAFNEEIQYSSQTLPAVLEMQIQKSNSTEELLKMSALPTSLLKHACMILHRLGQLAEADKSITMQSLLKDERFVKMCNLVHRADYSHNPHLLFAVLQGLDKLGVLETSDIYQTLHVELKWGMRRCQIRYLIRAIALFVPSDDNPAAVVPDKNALKEGNGNMDIVELAIHTLQRRWVEVVSGSDFNNIFKILQFLNEETRGKLEDRAVEMVSTFSPSEIRQIFITLAIQKRRPTPLLRTMAFHFAKCVDSSNTKDLIELTYALNELTFADPVLMEKILNQICPDISSVENPALISTLVTSLGQMRYKHKAIMRVLDEWIARHFKKLRPFDCATWLLTCAVLNHQSENTTNFCEQIKSVLTPKVASSHIEWINIVYAMLVLNSHSNALVASVLSPEMITSIENIGTKSYKSKIKLLNINATAKKGQTDTGYKGPFLNAKVESQWASSVLSTSDKKLATIAFDTMSSFLPSDKYLTLNQKLGCGVFVDAVCLLNKNKEPISHSESSKSKIPCQPVAFVVEGYSSMTLGIKEPTGHTVLNRKLLEKEGYTVIPIPYTEFHASDKLITRAKYLENKLKELGDDTLVA